MVKMRANGAPRIVRVTVCASSSKTRECFQILRSGKTCLRPFLLKRNESGIVRFFLPTALAGDYDREIEEIFQELDLPLDTQTLEQPAGELSFGQQKLLAFARLMAVHRAKCSIASDFPSRRTYCWGARRHCHTSFKCYQKACGKGQCYNPCYRARAAIYRAVLQLDTRAKRRKDF